MNMRDFLRQYAVFLSLMLLFVVVLGSVLYLVPKAELHLWLNSCHTTAGDYFFKYYTLVGDYGPYIVFAILLFFRFGDATFVVGSNLAAGLVAQIIKRTVNAPRPARFFDIANNPDILPLVEGVKMHTTHSFPSGHTATFFSMAIALTILYATRSNGTPCMKKVIIPTLLLLLAILGGYSRIYLSQHFAADIFLGSIIGVVFSVAIYPLFLRWEKKHQQSYNWHISIKKKSR